MGFALFKSAPSKLETKEEIINSMATAMVSALQKIDPSVRVGVLGQIKENLKNPVKSFKLDQAINNTVQRYALISGQTKNVLGVRNAIVNTPEYGSAQIATNNLIVHGRDYMSIFSDYKSAMEKKQLAAENRVNKQELQRGVQVSDKTAELEKEAKFFSDRLLQTASKYVETKINLTQGGKVIESYDSSLEEVLDKIRTHMVSEYTDAAAKVSVVSALEKLTASSLSTTNPQVLPAYKLNDQLDMFSNGVKKHLTEFDIKAHIKENGLSLS